MQRRAEANAIGVELLGPAGLRGLEPHAAGVAALHVPSAAVVDFRRVALALAKRVAEQGGEVRLQWPVTALQAEGHHVIVLSERGDVRARGAVTCAGLHADRLARTHGAALDDVHIVPFRGEYFDLVPSRRDLVRGLIYPVPDPAFPFLGAHLTRTIDGRVHAGPNAVLAFAREGYRRATIRPGDVSDVLRYRGFWRLARRH